MTTFIHIHHTRCHTIPDLFRAARNYKACPCYGNSVLRRSRFKLTNAKPILKIWLSGNALRVFAFVLYATLPKAFFIKVPRTKYLLYRTTSAKHSASRTTLGLNTKQEALKKCETSEPQEAVNPASSRTPRHARNKENLPRCLASKRSSNVCLWWKAHNDKTCKLNPKLHVSLCKSSFS